MLGTTLTSSNRRTRSSMPTPWTLLGSQRNQCWHPLHRRVSIALLNDERLPMADLPRLADPGGMGRRGSALHLHVVGQDATQVTQ